jgi:hypothetical protein
MGSAFTALWLSLVFTCELIWWAKCTIMSIVLAWQAGCMIHKTLDDLRQRNPAWVKVFDLWCSFMAAGTKFVTIPFGILIMTMAAVYNTVNSKPEDPAAAPDAPADARNGPAPPPANAPAADGIVRGSFVDNFLKAVNITPDTPARAPAAKNNRANPNNGTGRRQGPVLPAPQAKPANVVRSIGGTINLDALLARTTESAPKPSTVNPDFSGGGPGSPQAANPNKRVHANVDMYVLNDGSEITEEEYQNLYEAHMRNAALLMHAAKKTRVDGADGPTSP